jgi:steroid 5-alpha reductase family enzyme
LGGNGRILSIFSAAPTGDWVTRFSPVLMTYLLRYVSGVTILEKSLKSAKSGYKEYAATTNAFIS